MPEAKYSRSVSVVKSGPTMNTVTSDPAATAGHRRAMRNTAKRGTERCRSKLAVTSMPLSRKKA